MRARLEKHWQQLLSLGLLSPTTAATNDEGGNAGKETASSQNRTKKNGNESKAFETEGGTGIHITRMKRGAMRSEPVIGKKRGRTHVRTLLMSDTKYISPVSSQRIGRHPGGRGPSRISASESGGDAAAPGDAVPAAAAADDEDEKDNAIDETPALTVVARSG